MLEWFASVSNVDHAMNEGTLLNDIICRPEKLDENVNIFRIKKYFTDASWNRVLKAIELRKSMKYYCQVCERDLSIKGKDRCLFAVMSVYSEYI